MLLRELAMRLEISPPAAGYSVERGEDSVPLSLHEYFYYCAFRQILMS
jgi:hypothetical protein